MDSPSSILDIFLKLDEVLHGVLQTWGPWTYVLLFAIILCETGLVVMPFLPGDSLLFAAGAMAALYSDDLNVVALIVLLSIAAILGDTINYAIGRWLGPRAFTIDKWFLKHEHLERTQQFYARHGGKTIVLARFVPIVRTFAPFVAGVGRMHYPQFLFFNVVGADLHAGRLLLRQLPGRQGKLRTRRGGHRSGVGAADRLGNVVGPSPREAPCIVMLARSPRLTPVGFLSAAILFR